MLQIADKENLLDEAYRGETAFFLALVQLEDSKGTELSWPELDDLLEYSRRFHSNLSGFLSQALNDKRRYDEGRLKARQMQIRFT